MEISWDLSGRCSGRCVKDAFKVGRLQPRKLIKPRLKFGSLAARLSPCQKSPTGVRLWQTLSLHFNGHFDVKEPLSLIISVTVTAHRCSWNLHFPCLAASSHYCLMGLYRNFGFFNSFMEHLYKQTLHTSQTESRKVSSEMNLLSTPSLCWQHLAVQIAGVHVVHDLWFVWIWSKKFTTREASPARLNFCLNGSFLQPTKGTLTSSQNRWRCLYSEHQSVKAALVAIEGIYINFHHWLHQACWDGIDSSPHTI